MDEELRPVPWHRADLAVFAAFFLLAVFVVPAGFFLVLRLFSPRFQITDASGVALIFAQVLIDLAVVGFIFFIVRVHGLPVVQTLRWVRAEGIHVGWLISAGAFLALTVQFVSSVLPRGPDSPLEKLLTTPASTAALVIYGIAVAPLSEEIMFRGFLYTLLADLYSPRLAVPVTTFAFAALHFQQIGGNWPAMALILVVGYVLTEVRKRSDSLIPSFIMHTAYNSMIFGMGALSTVLQHGKVPS